MLWYPASATSKIYEIKVPTYENGKPEELPQMMKDFKTVIDGTGTTSATGNIHFMRTMFGGEDQIELDNLAGQVTGTTNIRLKFTKEGLLGYFPPINSLIK